MRQVLFIRHGATAGNLEKRYIGRTDQPLCDLGRQQALALAGKGLCVHRLFASPALRTVQTAETVFPGMGPTLLADLWETDFGDFEGKTAAELSHDPRYRAWVDAGCRTPCPNGEGIPAFKDRCCRAFLQAMAHAPDNTVTAFVIHGGCIMAILERFVLPKRDFYAYHIANGGLVRCRWEDGHLRIPEE